MKPVETLRLIAACSLLFGAGYWHLTLVDSRPKEDEVVAHPPAEIWLRFNQALDLEQCSIAVSGPRGAVELEQVRLADSLSLAAQIVDPLTPGEYTVSWLAAPLDDHGIRGRYRFTVETPGERQ